MRPGKRVEVSKIVGGIFGHWTQRNTFEKKFEKSELRLGLNRIAVKCFSSAFTTLH